MKYVSTMVVLLGMTAGCATETVETEEGNAVESAERESTAGGTDEAEVGEAENAMRMAGCSYSTCMSYCTGTYSFTYCHNLCRGDCD